MKLVPGDLDDPRVRSLLHLHLSGMRENSPPESVHALDLSGLATPDISLWTAWDGDDLLGCGALKELAPDSGEIKSMRTCPDHLRRGIGKALLGHFIAMARSRGYRRLSLETGSGPAFDPAIAMYQAAGFVSGPAFGGYEASRFNQFFHLDL